ncbi:IS21 family transposase [bacterium]|nr:MAG: IS21 family transposase [bacterium]
MAAKTVEMHRLQELVRLHRIGKPVREIARLLKIGRSTEMKYRKALEAADLLAGDLATLPELHVLKAAVIDGQEKTRPKHETSTVEPWRAEVETMLGRKATPKAIYDCLRVQETQFDCSLSAVKRFCARQRKAAGIQPEDVAIPVETMPGKVAQVDFGSIGRIYDLMSGKQRKAHIFVMTLGFSRRMFACLTFDQKVETWLMCHILAFEHFGGVVEVVVPDNLKSAVIRCAFAVDGEAALNRSYRELARYYGFIVDPTPPRSPEKKGKVESNVKYVKNNFCKPRDLNELGFHRAGEELKVWLEEVSDKRVHGTTRQRPIDRFQKEEFSMLLPMPQKRFELVTWKDAKVHRDSHIVFEKKLYSVPYKLIGEKVWVRATPVTVEIHFEEERVATHRRRAPGHRSTVEEHLPEHRAPWRHQCHDHWKKKAAIIGKDTALLVSAIFDSEDSHSKLRVVQSVVSHLIGFPEDRANSAARRALHFGNLTYQGIKDILRKGLDYEPLPGTQNDRNGVLDAPEYSRSFDDIVAPNL